MASIARFIYASSLSLFAGSVQYAAASRPNNLGRYRPDPQLKRTLRPYYAAMRLPALRPGALQQPSGSALVLRHPSAAAALGTPGGVPPPVEKVSACG